MRIGLLTTGFPRFEGDVAGHFVLGFARSLAERGHELEVLAPQPAEAIQPPCHPGVRVRWVPYLRPRGLQRTFYGAGVPDNLRSDARAWLGLAPFSAALTLQARRRMARWDAVVSHWALPCALSAAATRGGRPHLAVLHSADLHVLGRLPGRGFVASAVGQGASALSFVDDSLRDRFLSWLPAAQRSAVGARCFVQPMGIEAPTPVERPREALRKELGVRGFTALCLSRLVPVKALELAVEAAARSNVRLLVAGDGPERQRLTAQAQLLRAPVRFEGHVAGSHKAELLAAADVFVCCSRRMPTGRSEGVPTALLEAMARGLPCVVTRVGGMGALMEREGAALIIDPEQPRALAAALTRLRDDANLRARLAERGRQLAERHLWQQVAPRIESHLTDTLPA